MPPPMPKSPEAEGAAGGTEHNQNVGVTLRGLDGAPKVVFVAPGGVAHDSWRGMGGGMGTIHG